MTKEEFRPLPNEYTNAGYTFMQQKRGEKAVIYMTAGDKPIAEIFVIKTAKAVDSTVKGKPLKVPARERVPGNSDFGAWAWTVSGSKEKVENRAEIIFQEIETGTRPAPQEKRDSDDIAIAG